jgi:Bacterial protein of unknown function (DUF916)
MKLRSLARSAATLVVACFAFATMAVPARATTPPTSPPGDGDTTTTAPGALPASPSVSGQIEESWALTPVQSTDGDGSGNRSEFAYDAEPGTVIKDVVSVFNLGNVPEDFQVYATDAFNTDAGGFDILPGNEPPTDVGSWIDIVQKGVTLQPGQQANIPITITVPLDARPGDHAGAIVASSPTTGSDDAGNTVLLDRRTGSRVYIRVNGPLTAELAVTNVSSDWDKSINPLGGTAHVTYTIENRGNLRLGGTAAVTAAGPFGIGETKLKLPDVPELLPGAKITLTATVDDVTEVFFGRVTVRLTPTGGGGASTSASQATDTSFVPPIAVLLLLLLLVLLLLVWRQIRRRRAGTAASDPANDAAQAELELEHQPA